VFRRYNFEGGYEKLSEQAYDAWGEVADSFGEPILLPSQVLEAGFPG